MQGWDFWFEQSAMLFLNSTKFFLTVEDVGRIGVVVVFRNLLFHVVPLLITHFTFNKFDEILKFLNRGNK